MRKILLLCGLLVSQSYSATTWFSGYNFTAHLISKGGRNLSETSRGHRPTVFVRNGQEYSIVVSNPLPVRVAVAVSVDGLNTIDGKRSKPAQGPKWIIEPYSSLTIDGWQTSLNALRRFIFTPQHSSYAQWKEKIDKKDYTTNLGVIGVAWFWNSADLIAAITPPPPPPDYGWDDEYAPQGESAQSGRSPSAAKAAPRPVLPPRAGTGMGRKQENRVTRVAFDFDAGMYANGDVLKIFYEFQRRSQPPQPFEEEETTSGFAADMWK